MSIFDINYNNKALEWLSPDKRLPKLTGFVRGLLSPVQWLRDKFLGDYRIGGNYQQWHIFGIYAKGAKVIFKQTVYISLRDGNIDAPTYAPSWEIYLPSFLGVNERILFNGQKLILEYALNQYYLKNFRQPGLLGYYYPGNTPGIPNIPTTGYTLHSDIFTLNNDFELAGFNVGSLDFIPTWVSSHLYLEGDKVVHSQYIYQCITGNSDATFTIGKWTNLGSAIGILTSSVCQEDIGYEHYLSWSAATVYSKYDFVIQDNFIFISLTNNNQDVPPSANWYQLWGVGLSTPYFLGDNFTIYFPTATFAQTSEAEVRNFVNKILPAGIIYSIKTY